jgi:hypothetical protein
MELWHAAPIWLYTILVSLTCVIGDVMRLFSVMLRVFLSHFELGRSRAGWVLHGPRPNIMISKWPIYIKAYVEWLIVYDNYIHNRWNAMYTSSATWQHVVHWFMTFLSWVMTFLDHHRFYDEYRFVTNIYGVP